MFIIGVIQTAQDVVEDIFKKYLPMMKNLSLSIIRDYHLSEDAVQRAMLNLHINKEKMLYMSMVHTLGRYRRWCTNMKKGTLISCIFLVFTMLVFCMTACRCEMADTPDVLSPAIMIDGVIYYSQGNILEIAPTEESYSGHITSVVSEKSLPSQDGEANIQCLDAPYIFLEEGIAVYFNEKWLLFEILDRT